MVWLLIDHSPHAHNCVGEIHVAGKYSFFVYILCSSIGIVIHYTAMNCITITLIIDNNGVGFVRIKPLSRIDCFVGKEPRIVVEGGLFGCNAFDGIFYGIFFS
jgi:hypothetical protein